MRALVVDDSATVRALLVELLREEGFAVGAVTNGTEVIADARSHEPDIIILLDLTLPGLDGIAVCQRIRSFSDAYILMLTPGQTLTRCTLLQRVWGGTWHGSEHAISVHMSNLRRKPERDMTRTPLIKTVRGIGYRFDPPKS